LGRYLSRRISFCWREWKFSGRFSCSRILNWKWSLLYWNFFPWWRKKS